MPQATDELRGLMEKWFGDPIDDGPPMRFLFSRGYSEDRGLIRPPVPAHTVSCEEYACIAFMRDEWDYSFAGSAYPNYPRTSCI